MADWIDTPLGNNACPECKTNIVTASGDNGTVPVPGDLIICIACLALLKFAPDMEIVNVPEKEWQELSVEEQAKVIYYRMKIKETHE